MQKQGDIRNGAGAVKMMFKLTTSSIHHVFCMLEHWACLMGVHYHFSVDRVPWQGHDLDSAAAGMRNKVSELEWEDWDNNRTHKSTTTYTFWFWWGRLSKPGIFFKTLMCCVLSICSNEATRGLIAGNQVV